MRIYHFSWTIPRDSFFLILDRKKKITRGYGYGSQLPLVGRDVAEGKDPVSAAATIASALLQLVDYDFATAIQLHADAVEVERGCGGDTTDGKEDAVWGRLSWDG